MVKMEDFQLKPITNHNLEIVLKWRNSERIKSFMYTDKQIIWEEHIRWFEKVTTDQSYKVWLLHYKNAPLGLVNFSDINLEHSRCYWGFYIGDETAPKGSGTIMGILALEKMFHEIKINKVCAEVISTNVGSLKFHKKLGFEPEGKFVDHIIKHNQYMDVIPMSLFSSKWEKVKKELWSPYYKRGESNELYQAGK